MYSSGIYASSECTTSINHGVLIVGYGTHNTSDGVTLPYWLIKNRYRGPTVSNDIDETCLISSCHYLL